MILYTNVQKMDKKSRSTFYLILKGLPKILDWPIGSPLFFCLSACSMFILDYHLLSLICYKILTFLTYEFGKGQYTFYPVKLSRFAEKKNKVRRKYQNFIRGDPYELGHRPLQAMGNYKGGSGHPNFMNHLNMVKNSLTNYFQKDLEL